MPKSSYKSEPSFSTSKNFEVEKPHINNMGGERLESDSILPHETLSDRALKAISDGNEFSRVLLDLFAVSITPKIKNSELPLDYFLEYFFGIFNDLFEIDTFDFLDMSTSGGGYNALRKYSLPDGSTIQFRFFDPSKSKLSDSDYISGSAFKNYVRQKVNLKLTGNSLQFLRSKGILGVFLKRLFKTFQDLTVTMFDATADFFNYDLQTNYFVNLYQKNQVSTKSTFKVVGDPFNPSVYVGAFKGARTIVMYDKLTENKDKEESDEPQLFKALESCDGSWLRVEQHFTGDHKEANQIFRNLILKIISVDDDLIDSTLSENLAKLLSGQLLNKVRFLSKPKKKKNNELIPTDEKWQMILDTISNIKETFAFQRPILTLEEKKQNFKQFSIGGGKLFAEIREVEGNEKLMQFVNEVTDYQIAKQNEKEIQVLERKKRRNK